MSEINNLLDKAKNLRDQNDFIEALEILEQLFKENPNSEETKTALIDSNQKLTTIIYSIFQGYQANVNAVIENNKKLNEEIQKIKNFLKEKIK